MFATADKRVTKQFSRSMFVISLLFCSVNKIIIVCVMGGVSESEKVRKKERKRREREIV